MAINNLPDPHPHPHFHPYSNPCPLPKPQDSPGSPPAQEEVQILGTSSPPPNLKLLLGCSPNKTHPPTTPSLPPAQQQPAQCRRQPGAALRPPGILEPRQMESDAHKAQRETEAGARRAVSPGLRLSRDIPVAGNRDKQWGQQAESRPAAGNVCPRPTPLPSGAPPQPQRHTQPGAGCWLLSRLDFSEVRPGRSAAPLHALLGSALRSPARERVPEAWSRTRVPPKTPPSSPVPSGPRRALRGSRSHRPQRGWRRSGPTWHRHEVPPHPHRPQPGGTRPGAAAVTAPSVATKLCGASSRARVGRENPELLAPLRRPTAGSPGPQFPHRFAQPMTGDPRDGAGKHRGRHLSRSTVPAALPTLRDARGGAQGGSSEFPAGCSTPPPPPHPAHLPSAPLSTAAASRHRRSRCRFHNGRGELKRAPGSGERGGVAQKPGPPAPPQPAPRSAEVPRTRVERGKGGGGWKIPRDPRRAPAPRTPAIPAPAPPPRAFPAGGSDRQWRRWGRPGTRPRPRVAARRRSRCGICTYRCAWASRPRVRGGCAGPRGWSCAACAPGAGSWCWTRTPRCPCSERGCCRPAGPGKGKEKGKGGSCASRAARSPAMAPRCTSRCPKSRGPGSCWPCGSTTRRERGPG